MDNRYPAYREGMANPFTKVVWSDDLPGELPSPAHSLLFSGPPLTEHALQGWKAVEDETKKIISYDPETKLTPIGFVQDVNYNAGRAVRRVPELGNRNDRLFGSRFQHAIVLNRVMSRHVNLVGALYHWYLKQGKDTFKLALEPSTADGVRAVDPNGYMVMSLDSDLLNYPIGLCLVHLTEKGEQISAEYWEHVLISGFGKQVSAREVLIIESVQLVCGRVIPLPQLFSPRGGFQPFELLRGGRGLNLTHPLLNPLPIPNLERT